MEVQVYDGRTRTWRTRDVATPLKPEITLSVWLDGGYHNGHRRGGWHHDVYRRIGGGCRYAFIGTAPTGDNYLGVPAHTTTPWPGVLTDGF